jgi:hypothetical protein
MEVLPIPDNYGPDTVRNNSGMDRGGTYLYSLLSKDSKYSSLLGLVLTWRSFCLGIRRPPSVSRNGPYRPRCLTGTSLTARSRYCSLNTRTRRPKPWRRTRTRPLKTFSGSSRSSTSRRTYRRTPRWRRSPTRRPRKWRSRTGGRNTSRSRNRRRSERARSPLPPPRGPVQRLKQQQVDL